MNPKVIYIETTTHCNADCIMCPHRLLRRARQTMSPQLFSHILDGIERYDVSGVQIFLHKEGEPLCDENIAERIALTRERLPSAREVGLSTNAMLLTERLSEDLVKSGMNVIFFSVDGASSKTYDEIRRNCKYEIVERNIRRFLEKRNASDENIRVVMQMLITDLNKHERSDFIRKWQEYGVEFYFKDVHCYLDGGMSSFGKADFSRQIGCCQDPFRVLVYHVDGRAGLCCWDYDCEYVVGHAEERDMMQLFNGVESQRMREQQTALNCYGIAPCNRCGRIFGKDRISGT